MNAIENLAVFAPLVLVAAIVEVSTKATVLSAQISPRAWLTSSFTRLAFRLFELWRS
jgi:hypothetical protein